MKRLLEEGLPYVVSVKSTEGIWAPAEAIHSPQEAVEELPWGGLTAPGPWQAIVRQFRDGHTETWWAAELVYGPRMALSTPDGAWP